MLTFKPLIGWIDSALVIAFSALIVPGGGWLCKKAVLGRADKRDREKIYKWLLENTGPDADLYDMATMKIASNVNLPVDRVNLVHHSSENQCLPIGRFQVCI